MSKYITNLRLIGAVLSLGVAGPALADAPEQLYEPSIEAGGWRLEYNGQIGNTIDAERPHSVELFHGISERFAVGFEVEGSVEDSRFAVEQIGLGAIIGLTGENAPVEAAILVQAGVTTDGEFPQIQTRLMLEHDRGPWSVLGNVIVKRIDAEEQGTSLGYAATAHYELTEAVALGMETSGQVARLGGYELGFETAQYAGPSLIISQELGEHELGIGVKYLRRLDHGAEFRDTVRLNLSMEF